MKKNIKKKKRFHLKNVLLYVFETILLIFVTIYGTLFVVARGPSTVASEKFVHTVRETSALKFLANLYFSNSKIEQMESQKTASYEQTDTSLVTITEQTGKTDAWGKTDDDGDGIIVEQVKGNGYQGYMLIALDPSRVIMGAHPETFGSQGYTVEEMVQSFNAVAGINAGGFQDPNGTGDGSIPDSLVVYEGQIYYEELGTGNGFVGFDADHILHTGAMTVDEIRAANIQYGCCFGPALVVNGQPVDTASLESGINPRTAIGQRSDGAILMLVIDGRQASSLGASYEDLCDIMVEYGAVTACNLDGGSSSMLYYNGSYVNNSSSVIGIRQVPTTFIVKAKEES